MNKLFLVAGAANAIENYLIIVLCSDGVVQLGFLDVVVSPDVLDDPDAGAMDEGIPKEGGQIQLVCIATGVPPPTVRNRSTSTH